MLTLSLFDDQLFVMTGFKHHKYVYDIQIIIFLETSDVTKSRTWGQESAEFKVQNGQ